MPVQKGIRWTLVGILGKALFWAWAKCSRIKVYGEDEYLKLRRDGKPVIFLMWHRKIFLAPYFFRRRGVMPLVSPSRDGEFVARILDRWGYKVLRGSSSHSVAKAWQVMKKELEAGGELIIVGDGPRGPDRVLKAGCVKLAKETGAYLVPFTFSASKTKIFDSWDKFVLFYPFSRVAAVYGKPITVDPSPGKDALEAGRKGVEGLMFSLEQEAEQLLKGRQHT
jgi:hypothetical protein